MLRQRRMGGDQEEMGGYYIGEVDEVIIQFFHIVEKYALTLTNTPLLLAPALISVLWSRR